MVITMLSISIISNILLYFMLLIIDYKMTEVYHKIHEVEKFIKQCADT